MTTHPIPDKALAQHVIALGKTRSGKSSVMRLLIEHLLDQNKPVCIIDPKGDWWGLKSSSSGKQAGYPVIIFGGEHADVPINQHSGAYVAELVATGNRPCIIDLGGWIVGERTRFFIDFASNLFRHTRGPRWLCIDEVHNFAPQGKILDPDAGKMLHWANRLASEGAGKGITLISASQRPQKVHKDYVTSNETLIAMRVIHELDRRAMKEWIDGCADPAVGKEVLETLAGMQRGEGWVWSPEIGFGPKRIQFPMFKTYDSFKAPSGEIAAKLTGWAAVDLDEVKAKLAKVVEEAKANDPKALKAEILRLAAELKKAQNIPKNIPPSAEVIEAAERKAFDRGSEQGFAEGVAVGQREAFVAARERVLATAAAIDALAAEAPQRHVNIPKSTSKYFPPPKPSAAPREADSAKPRPASNGELTPSLRRVLDAIAWWKNLGFDPVDRARASVVAGYSPRASTFHVYIAKLSNLGFVNVTPGGISLSETGLLLANAPVAGSAAELADMVRALLKPQQIKVFDAIYEAYPNGIRREDVAEKVGLSPTASTVHVYIAGVAAYGIIESGAGQVRAADWLFP